MNVVIVDDRGGGDDMDFVQVSIVDLIVNGSGYHGKRVLLHGFLCLEFEGTAVYLHQDHCAYVMTENAVWVDVPAAVMRRRGSYDRRYIRVVGTFNAQRKGHLGVFRGAVEKVTRV